MTARPELPPGVTVYTRTAYDARECTWMLRDAGGTMLQRGAGSYDEAVAQAWAQHDANPGPWVTYADALEAATSILRSRISTVLDLLAANGCDCECDCDNNHNDDCDRCLACRVAATLAGIEEAP